MVHKRSATVGLTSTLVVLAFVSVLFGAARLSPTAAQEPLAGPGGFRFDGGGWGHGIGMSQWGTHRRADRGDTAEQILRFYYPTTAVTDGYAAAPAKIRVHVATASTMRVEGSGPVDLAVAGRVIATTTTGVTVDRTGATFTVVDTSGKNLCIIEDPDAPPPAPGVPPRTIDACVGSRVVIDYAEGDPTRLRAPASAAGSRYRWGKFAFTATPSGSLYAVIEALPMDRYLYGLAEVPSSWPHESLRAQSIAARSYATEAVVRRRADSGWTAPWDLYSTTLDQAYVGYAHEVSDQADRWLAAVDSTSAMIILGNGSPVGAFYSSSNGGHSEDSGYVFLTSFPWFPAQPDPPDLVDSPHASWTRQYTPAELSRWVARSSLGSVGVVQRIEVSGRFGASGRTDKATVTIVGSAATKTTTGVRFMWLINSGVISEGGSLNRQVLSTKYTVRRVSNRPVGTVDLITVGADRARVVGWAYDDDDGLGTVPVEITVDGAVAASDLASVVRPDISAAFGRGSARGFDMLIPVGPGRHEVCVYGEDMDDGVGTLLGCQVIAV